MVLMLGFSSLAKSEEAGLGHPDSKVTVIEYGSLTCDYCIRFHRDVLPPLAENYINKLKVFFVFRHYPTSKAALQAAIAAECTGDNFYPMLDALYHSVGEWYSLRKPAEWFEKKAATFGVDKQEFRACYNDDKTKNKILTMQKNGRSEFGVKGTPTFVINGEVVSGKKSYQELKVIIDKHLAN